MKRVRTPVVFHAHVSKDWSQDDPSTYDPDYVWEDWFESPAEAMQALRRELPRIVKATPWTPGYLPCIMHCGPRGGVYKVTLERTVDHRSLQATLDALAARQ